MIFLCGLNLAVWLLPPLARTLRELWRQYATRSKSEAAVIAVFVLCAVYVGGTKPTNTQSQAQSGGVTDMVMIAETGDAEQIIIGGGPQMSLLEGGELPRLTSNQYAAGFALLPKAVTNTAWLAVPSNAVTHSPWTRYGLAEDTFWLPATNWAFVLGTNAVEGAHVSSSGTLSFDPGTPKGSPRATAMPDGDTVSFLAPLQGSLGTVPPQGRFWHAVTASNSVLMTWQDLYAGRDTNSPVTLQAELFGNGDFTYRYALYGQTCVSALTNFVIGAQHNLGGETYALNDTNRLANGLELRWRALGALDPGVDDHDDDGVTTYEEVMTHESDPTMPDTDLDGLGDAAEDPAVGPYSRVRDSDGDGLIDGSDPVPMSADSQADLDGDGLPDAWENYRFGGTNVTGSADADTNGDGFSDRVNLLTGTDPAKATTPGFAVTNSAPVTGIDAWEIAPAFALDAQAGMTNILSRTIQVNRTSPWQQYFISSDPRAAGAWTLDGLELSWLAGTDVSGSAAASPAGDSMRLGLGTNLVGSATFRLAPARTAGLLRSPRPLYLVRWTLQPAFTPGPTVAAVTDTNGVRHVAAVLEYGGAEAMPFTANTGARPHNAAPGESETAELSLPPDPESEVYPLYPAGIGTGCLTAPEPSQATLPASGTNAPVRVLLYKLEVFRGGGIEAEKPFGQFSAPYPLSSAGLRSKWLNNAVATESLNPDSITVTTGLDSDVLRIRINGEETDTFMWTDEEDSALMSLPLMTMSALDNQACGCEGGALIEVSLCDSNILDRCEEEEPKDYDTDVTDGDDDDDDECECGETDGGQVGSLKFRISLGSGGRDRISGFLWFAIETAQAVTPGLFNVLGDPYVIVTTNAGVISVVCPEENGRTATIESVDDGVLVSVRDANDALEHTWTITNPPGSPDSVRLVKRDQADNPVSDETYAYSAQNGQWGRTDNLGGAAETLTLSGDLETEGQQCETRSLSAGGVKASETVSYSHAIGSGEAAVARVTDKYTYAWSGFAHTYLRRQSVYWSDNLNASRNGRLRLRYGDGTAWEYHAYDGRGRETLSSGPLNGSSHHQDMAAGDGIGTVAELSAMQGLACTATASDYTADFAAGDTGDADDSREPRTATSYVVRNGNTTVISREWHVYTRGVTNDVPTVAVRTVRAASASAAFDNAANAVSFALAYAGSEKAAVPPALWNLPLLEKREDGTVMTWVYESGSYSAATDTFTPAANGVHLRVTARTGTAACPNGIEGVSAYTVEIRDAAFGRTLKRETRLHASGDPVLSWAKMTYDIGGHMRGAVYSDGTSETNVWDCCRLQSKVGRDGRRTDYMSVPGINHWSATAETSLGSLPGSLDRYPVTEIFTDALDRETNRVRTVWFNGSRDSGYTPVSTGTGFPYGTDNCMITADAFGVRTVATDFYGDNCQIGETASAGVTNRTVSVWGGQITSEKRWTDPVSGLNLTRATRTSKDWDASGCETETVSVSRNGGGWINESVTIKDFLGRVVTSAQAGFGGAMLVSSNLYDSAGRTLMTVGHDGSRTIYAYDTLGDSAGTVRIGAGQTLQFDPLSFALANVIALDAYVVGETLSWKEEGDLGLSAHGVPSAYWDCKASVSHIPGQGSVTTSVRRVQLTGLSAGSVKRLVSTDANGVTVITTEAVDAANAKTTVSSVNTAIGAFDVAESVAGVQTAGTNSLGGAISYAFDGFARQVSAEETAGDRTLRRATGYHDDGTVALTAEICGTVSNVTTYSERQYLQEPEDAYTVTATDALGNETVSYYKADGSPYRAEGATYPTATALNEDGNRSELCTWRDETGQPDITRWHYDQASGLVTNKVYADGKGPSYTYTADGRMASRTWARDAVTEYGYADTTDGSTMTVTYNDGTPAVSNGYNLAGQLVYVSDGTGGRTLSYNAKGQLTAETNSLAVITRRYDALARDTGYDLDLSDFGGGSFQVIYGYDSDGRLDRVTSALNGVTNTFCYSYVTDTSLVAGMTNSAGFGWSRSYEPNRNLITAVSNYWSASTVSTFGYVNDAMGRRTLRVDSAQSLSATNVFAYNHRSEVTNAAMAAATHSYAYDDIGNRHTSSVNAVPSTYTANSLNQYTAVAGGLSCSPTYDLDGNMTWDGVFSHTWDAENRLTKSEPGWIATNGAVLVENSYDYQNRRVMKVVKQLSGRGAGYPMDPSQPGMWNEIETRRYVWDGWNIAAEINIDEVACTTNITRYVWGQDLSGSIRGAGGVGGLLAEMRGDGSIYFPCYDANGNVTDYVDVYGTVRGHFEYDAFGNTVAMWGDLAHTFKFRFSTKYWNSETGHYYYIGRFYSPVLGRWVNRDPIEEVGGENLFVFTENNGVNRHDPLGFTWSEVIAWFGEWVNGKGETFKAFGPRSNAASDMKNAPGVNKARAFFKEKNKSVKCCRDLSSVTNYKSTFGLAGLFAAGFNSTQQFTGRYRVDILVSGCKNKKCEIDFELTNTTSFKSFLYGIGPSWHREEFRFMGNVTQTIWWTEVYDAECP